MQDSALHHLHDLSMNGLREILEAKSKLAQRFWIVVLLLCHVLTAFYIYRVIHEYLTSVASSQIKFEEHDIYHFPNIFLCTTRWYNVSKMREAGLNLDAIKYGLSIFRQNHTLQDAVAAHSELTAFLIRNNYDSLTSFFVNMSVFSGENPVTLIDQALNRQQENIVKNITRDAQMRICVNVILGNITQNHVKSWGEFAGRILQVDLPDDTDGIESTDTTYMIVYSQIERHEPSDTDQYVYLSLNRRYHVNIIPTHFHYENDECVDPKQEPRYKEICVNTCKEKFIDQLSKSKECIGLYHLSVRKERERGLSNLSSYCTGATFDDVSWKTYNDAAYYCNLPSQCRPCCELEVLEITQSTAVLSLENSIRRLYIAFRLHTENGILTIREVKTYSFDTLVSNLGGVLGLWLGANMFTVIQLGAFAWNYASVVYRTGRTEPASRLEIDMKLKQELGDAVANMSTRMDSFEKIINQLQIQFGHSETLLDKAQVGQAT